VTPPATCWASTSACSSDCRPATDARHDRRHLVRRHACPRLRRAGRGRRRHAVAAGRGRRPPRPGTARRAVARTHATWPARGAAAAGRLAGVCRRGGLRRLAPAARPPRELGRARAAALARHVHRAGRPGAGVRGGLRVGRALGGPRRGGGDAGRGRAGHRRQRPGAAGQRPVRAQQDAPGGAGAVARTPRCGPAAGLSRGACALAAALRRRRPPGRQRGGAACSRMPTTPCSACWRTSTAT
jgi:hypothetical protein